MINLTVSTQISAFWLSPNFVFKFQCFYGIPLSLKFWTFWSIFPLSLKFQHFDQLNILHSNFNILIDILKVVLKFQYSDQFLFFNQIPIIWSISTFAIEYQILIDLPFFAQISTFWSIWHLALKFQHFDQFPPYCTQMSTFWLIPHFSLKIQHFERFGD